MLSSSVKRMNNSETLPIAFVLMKFSADPWKDRTYLAMCDVLDEAGFRALRADQIQTSGPVVDEICEHLRDAPLALIDTSGDSHSVSYELGYAHGVGRAYDKTIVLRSQASGQIPFNYAHFRLIVYRDQRHLKRLLRSWLNLSMPISDDQLGFALNFSIMPDAGEYGDTVASAILGALGKLRFSGRCEYYAGDVFISRESFYMVGLAVRADKGSVPKGEWWKRLSTLVSVTLGKKASKATLNPEDSEIGEVRSLRKQCPPRGVVEFEKGVPVFVLKGGLADDSWFLAQCRERMAV